MDSMRFRIDGEVSVNASPEELPDLLNEIMAHGFVPTATYQPNQRRFRVSFEVKVRENWGWVSEGVTAIAGYVTKSQGYTS